MPPKGWGRRARTTGGHRAPGGGALLALAAVCGTALVLAACGQFTTADPGPYYPAIGAASTPTATVAPLGYTVAAWATNSGPPAGSPVGIVVAFHDAGLPVPGAQVSLSVVPAGSYTSQSYGPLTTNATGYAGFTLSGEGDQPDLPMLVQVSVTYQGQTYTASTEFTPSP